MTALETLCNRKSKGETLNMAEFAVWVLFNTVRYSTAYRDTAQKTVEVCERAADVLVAKDAVIEAASEEVDEFNAGYAAFEGGEPIENEYLYDTKYDVWRIGWVWAQYKAAKESEKG